MKKKRFLKTACSCILGATLLLSSTSSSYASQNIQDIDSIADTVSELFKKSEELMTTEVSVMTESSDTPDPLSAKVPVP